MIWLGTSGWVYPHWIGRFYPPDLAVHDQLPYYARHFPTVEINRSFYRLPTREQFQSWAEQVSPHPGFRFAIKASRYITHLKKLSGVDEGITRLYTAAQGLGEHAGPFLYQLPPRWHANVSRLQEFVTLLPRTHQAAFEFRDPAWLQPEIFPMLERVLEEAGCSLVVGIGGELPTPLNLPPVGPFGYLRFHHGKYGTGFSDEELAFWVERLAAEAIRGREVYVYFNNDPEGYAIHDALRLRELLGNLAVQPQI